MSYTQEKLAMLQLGSGAPQDLSVAAVHSTSFLVGSQMDITRCMAHVSVVTVGAATVQCKKRPLQGSAVGEVVLATLVIPDATPAGKIIYKDFDEVTLQPGDEIVYEVTAAATSGSAHYMQEVEQDPEQASEQADMMESA